MSRDEREGDQVGEDRRSAIDTVSVAGDRLAVIVVSHNSADWLSACLSSVYTQSGELELEIVVVDSGSTDDTVDLVRREFPDVHIVTTENRGFAAANNRGLEVVDAEWVLFLNPDTRLLSGTLEQLVSALRTRPTVGLVGVRQVDENGALDLTMRRFPNAARLLFESLGAERLGFRASWLGQRVLDASLYDRETRCDWTSGSFMLARRDAIAEVGPMDERFFLYCEETDFCLRMHQAGWNVVHLPFMTIFHQSSRTADETLSRQMAFARRQYAVKHFVPIHRAAATLALGLGYAIRSILPGRGVNDGRRRASARSALATLVGLSPPPFGSPSSR
jgi:GT2 family glycosyltransferase